MNVGKLKQRLRNILPIHDTPIGTIHPYWARKPMNIIDELILAFTDEGDLILDPFMGSGTTVFSAIKNKRTAIGSDINPLSILIVEELINLSNSPAETKALLGDFIDKVTEGLLPLFHLDDNRYIERERFEVNGTFENGQFTLKVVETISKVFKNKKWSGRRVENIEQISGYTKNWEPYLNFPISFSTIQLVKNSRIAIPAGATLADFYTEKNRICINYILDLIENSHYSDEQSRACKFLLSSALPLLRLSDKKASSQWPYWRPKKFLTSRNPVIVIHDRLKKVIKGIEWLKEVGIFGHVCHIENEISNYKPMIAETSIQELQNLVSLKPKLILTDPPYSDHVPYLEYSAIWNKILGFDVNNNHFSNEIVNTDAPSRKSDTLEYQTRLSAALKICSEMIDPDGTIIWFYQDQELKNWEEIYTQSKNYGLEVVDVISLTKQRRSMKSVTSPNKTLDGDLIIIFSKTNGLKKAISKKRKIIKNNGLNYFESYASIIKDALINGTMPDLAQKYKNINELINN